MHTFYNLEKGAVDTDQSGLFSGTCRPSGVDLVDRAILLVSNPLDSRISITEKSCRPRVCTKESIHTKFALPEANSTEHGLAEEENAAAQYRDIGNRNRNCGSTARLERNPSTCRANRHEGRGDDQCYARVRLNKRDTIYSGCARVVCRGTR